MTLLAGSVSVDNSGNATGSGYALVYFQLLLADTTLPDPSNAAGVYGPNPLPDAIIQQLVASRLSLLQSMAKQSTRAASIIPYIVANAVISLAGAHATIDTATSAGVLPASIVAGAPIAPPAANVTLPVWGGGTLT